MSLIKCPECEKEISDKAEICPHCGYPIKGWDPEPEEEPVYEREDEKSLKKCPNCGYANDYSNHYCDKCGCSFVIEQNSVSSDIERAIHEKFYQKLWFLLICLFIFPPVGIVLCWVFKKPKDIPIRIALSAFFGLCFIFIVAEPSENNNDRARQAQQTVTTTEHSIDTITQEQEEIPSESDEENETIISVGVYLIGEDIEPGKYDLRAIKGTGNVKLYNTYEEYSNDEIGYDAFQDYDVLTAGASRGLLNEDVCTDVISNIRLEEGQCLIVESGLELTIVPSAEINYDELNVGTYIVGEDIETGKYDFVASQGTGTMKVYNTYEEYKKDETGFDAFRQFDILAAGASRGLLNEDVCTDRIMCIRLQEGQCIAVEDGLKLQCSLSESVDSSKLYVGVYIVGEDIQPGKYDLRAIKGTGEFRLYNTYEDYSADAYGLEALHEYSMKEEDASAGLLNEDVYTQSLSNIRLENGNCIVINDGLILEYTIK